MEKIIITQKEFGKAEKVFSSTEEFKCIPAPAKEKELAKVLKENDAKYAIIGVDKYYGPLYEAIPEGGVIARFGIGYDGVDQIRATERGICCTNTPGVLDVSVAEYAITLILIASRKIMELGPETRKDSWIPAMGCELKGKTLAIIGCGSIGTNVAQIAAFGLKMKIIGCEIQNIDEHEMKNDYGFEKLTKEFDEAVSEANYISLHIPLNDHTKHFINEATIQKLPKKSWLINTARGPIIDEIALFKALRSKRIAGAVLDVYENEPYKPVHDDYDLRKLNNIIMLPHIGSYTEEACNRMAKKCLQNIKFADIKEYEKMDLLNKNVLNQY